MGIVSSAKLNRLSLLSQLRMVSIPDGDSFLREGFYCSSCTFSIRVFQSPMGIVSSAKEMFNEQRRDLNHVFQSPMGIVSSAKLGDQPGSAGDRKRFQSPMGIVSSAKAVQFRLLRSINICFNPRWG